VSETNPNAAIAVASHLALGRRGEELAAAYLQQRGYRIVAANFVIPVGRNRLGALTSVEIDLVAYDGETLCFVEVKTRGSEWFAEPQANVDLRKQRQVSRAARAYRRMFDLEGQPYRFDVVTIVLDTELPGRPKIKLLRGYWNEERLRKRFWSDNHYE
jgi:putative endonuclease